MADLLYSERSRFVPAAVGWLAVGGSLGVAAWQIVSSRRHHDDPLFLLVMMPSLATVVLLGVLLALWSLTVELRQDELVIHLRPLIKRRIFLREIESCDARTYRPLREYLGWGWRYGPSGHALTVRGTRGVQLVLRSGERLLVGSDRPEELARAIEDARRAAL
jgi:hypothetical protein